MIRSTQEQSRYIASPAELQRYVPARPQTSIARLQGPVSSDGLQLTANILEPASSNELHYDVPAPSTNPSHASAGDR
jgi:hypothetical protein